MALSDELNDLLTDMRLAQNAASAREIMRVVRDDLVRSNTELQAIVDSNSLTNLPTELKTALVQTWNVLKAAETALENATIVELLDWRP